jgi:glycosyltransferase involved in cell wall biosynthesis
MKFSVIIASYLGDYRNAAKDRELKIVRAVNSVLKQSFQDFEIIIVADGCERTVEIIEQFTDLRVKTYLIDKCKMWSGEPRNAGIDSAKGEYIVYLDIDDLFGEDHLRNIAAGLNGYDWVWFDDVRYNPISKEWFENPCDIRRAGEHGTSNICHKAVLPYRWDHSGYAHDYYFVKHLKQNHNFAKIKGGEYYVCHIPNTGAQSIKGYDL